MWWDFLLQPEGSALCCQGAEISPPPNHQQLTESLRATTGDLSNIMASADATQPRPVAEMANGPKPLSIHHNWEELGSD